MIVLGEDPCARGRGYEDCVGQDRYPWSLWFHYYVGDYAGGVLGRATAITDRTQMSAFVYDHRGQVIWTGRFVAVVPDPGSAASTLTGTADPGLDPFDDDTVAPSTVVYDGLEEVSEGQPGNLYWSWIVRDHGGRLSDRYNNGGTSGSLQRMTYDSRGLPQRVEGVITDVQYAADGQVEQITYSDGDAEGYDHPSDRAATVQTTEYDIRRRPVRTTVVRERDEGANPGTLPYVNRLVDQQLVWDVASNLTAVVDDRDPAEWPEGFRPQTVHIDHDSLYRVAGADFSYTQDNGSRAPDVVPVHTEFGRLLHRVESVADRPMVLVHISDRPSRGRNAHGSGITCSSRVADGRLQHGKTGRCSARRGVSAAARRPTCPGDTSASRLRQEHANAHAERMRHRAAAHAGRERRYVQRFSACRGSSGGISILPGPRHALEIVSMPPG